jgi:hypothetical protein
MYIKWMPEINCSIFPILMRSSFLVGEGRCRAAFLRSRLPACR